MLARFIINYQNTFTDWYKIDAVRGQLMAMGNKYKPAVDLIDFVTQLDPSNPQGALAVAYVLAKHKNQQANVFPKEVAILLYLRGASDRAISALSAAGLSASHANVFNDIKEAFLKHVAFCVQKLASLQDPGPLLLVINVDDFHVGAVLRCVCFPRALLY